MLLVRGDFLDLDRFIIRKGHGVYDLNSFIQAAMNNPQSPTDALSYLEDHDVLHPNFTGVEADAVKLAIDRGLINIQDTENIMAGPESGETYHASFRKAVNAGAPYINEAIERTNRMHSPDGNLLPRAFGKDMGNYVVDPQWRNHTVGEYGGPRFDSQRNLVTVRRSKITGKPEAYERWYHHGLEQMRQERPGPQKGGRKKTKDYINPSLIHHDTVYINDTNMLVNLHARVVEAMNNVPEGQDPFHFVRSLVKMDPKFKAATGGLSHGVASEMHGRYSDQNLQQYEVEQPVDPVDPYSDMVMPEGINARRLVNNSYHPDITMSGATRLANALGISPEQSADILRDVHLTGNQSSFDGSSKLARLKHAIFQLQNGHIEPQQPSEQPQEESQTTEEVVSTPPQTSSAPPPPMASSVGAPPAPMTNVASSPPMQGNAQIGTMPPMVGQVAPQGGRLGNIAEFLGQLYGRHIPGVLKQDGDDRDMVEQALEDIQMEIAKNEMETVSIQKMDSGSPVDVSMFAGQMNLSSNDVVAIVHSRGDWRTIAKSFDIPYEQVQITKVVFNG